MKKLMYAAIVIISAAILSSCNSQAGKQFIEGLKNKGPRDSLLLIESLEKTMASDVYGDTVRQSRGLYYLFTKTHVLIPVRNFGTSVSGNEQEDISSYIQREETTGRLASDTSIITVVPGESQIRVKVFRISPDLPRGSFH